MSNRRKVKRPRPDLEAGARLGLLRSAQADGCTCAAPAVRVGKIDLTGSTPAITGDVFHTDTSCPLWEAGPAAPQRLADLVPEADRAP